MIDINLFDQGFVGQACSVPNQTPRLMRYVRDRMDWDGVTVFTGQMMLDPIVDEVRSRYKIGWLNGDARCLRPYFYDEHWKVARKFDAIMTHDAELLRSGGWHFDTPQHALIKHVPYLKTIRGGSWVPPEQWAMYPKTKNVSMILSEKTTLEGHTLRHAIAAAGLPIDLYGPEYSPIGTDKSIAYRDYRFAVVVEACQEENFFSEHLLDALAYGCMPIYWGCPNVHTFFPGGFAPLMNVEHLSMLLNTLGYGWEASYQSARQRIQEHQQRARTYAITEDWQIDNCLKAFL